MTPICTRPEPHRCTVDGPCNGYPQLNADSVDAGFWEVYHDDDCGEAFGWFDGKGCPKCGFRPDMQSIAARRTKEVS